MMSLGGRKCYFDIAFDNTSVQREVGNLISYIVYSLLLILLDLDTHTHTHTLMILTTI